MRGVPRVQRQGGELNGPCHGLGKGAGELFPPSDQLSPAVVANNRGRLCGRLTDKRDLEASQVARLGEQTARPGDVVGPLRRVGRW
jgi:hypothetical protein